MREITDREVFGERDVRKKKKKMRIVLDTNVYRNLVKNKTVDEIAELEQKIKNTVNRKNIEIFFPIIPAMELVNHYNDENIDEREECRKALRLLVKLSTKWSEGSIKCKFVFPMDTVLTYYFFKDYGNFLDEYNTVITYIQKLCGNIPVRKEEKMESFISDVSKIINYEKNAIKTNYEDYLKSINNGDIDWSFYKREENKKIRKQYFQSLKNGRLSYLVAMSFVIRAYDLLDKKYDINSEEFREQTNRFIEKFCPILVMNELLLDNIGQGVEKIKDIEDKRWNTILDISLMFGVLSNPKGEENVKLITNDKNIIKAFDICGHTDKAITLNSFLDMLKIT